MEASDDGMGPIDIVVIAYPADAPMTGEAVPLLLDLVDRGVVDGDDALDGQLQQLAQDVAGRAEILVCDGDEVAHGDSCDR